MAVLVAGGAGFIGANFVRSIIDKGERVINLDLLTYAGNLMNLEGISGLPGYRFVRGSIGDSTLVSELLQSEPVRAIINFAAESHVDRSISFPENFVQTNIVDTAKFLQSAREYHAGLNEKEQKQFRFVHVSTDEVFGTLRPADPAFTEESPYRPNSPYAASKAASDHLVRAYHETYGLPTITTNCSNNYGPFQFPEKLIPLVVHNALSGLSLPIYGDGQQVRDWLFVRDHCRGISKALEQGKIGETYNFGGRNEVANLDVVRMICALLDEIRPRTDGRRYADQIEFVKDRQGHDRRYAVNISRAEKELDWRPEETFESGLRYTVNWYLSNQAWIDSVTSGSYRDWIAHQYKSQPEEGQGE